MIKVCIFDAFGTLFNVKIPVEQINEETGGKAEALLNIWRTKQLEYTRLRTLMNRYKPFNEITKDALTYAMNVLDIKNRGVYATLMPIFLEPLPFYEVRHTLERLKANGCINVILSNGTPDMLRTGIENSGLRMLIDDFYSVDVIKKYKPIPEVYELPLKGIGVKKSEALFFSANNWDVAGAVSAGLKTVWVNRQQEAFDELPKPTFEIPTLEGAERLIYRA